jgi:hypothetical protein
MDSYFNNAKKGSAIMEVFVPIGIFVLGILISLKTGGLGIQRIIEGKKN